MCSRAAAPSWGKKDCLVHASDDINSVYTLYRYNLWLYIYLIKWENRLVIMFHFHSMRTVQSTIYSAVICINHLEFLWCAERQPTSVSSQMSTAPSSVSLVLTFITKSRKSPLHTVLNFLSSWQPKIKGESRNPKWINMRTTRKPAVPQYVIRTVLSKGM